MGRAEDAGEQPRPDSPAIQQAKTGPSDPQDYDVDELDRALTELESTLTPEDLPEGVDLDRHRRTERLLGDAQKVRELAAAGFTGPAMEVVKGELAEYAIAVLMAWTRNGEIMKRTRARGRPISVVEYGPGRWEYEDRLELAIETTARALDYFVDTALAGGRWDPRKGAALKTYFVGACVLQFPNVYAVWAREQNQWARHIEASDEPDEPTSPHNPTSDTALEPIVRNELLRLLDDPVTRRAAELIADGVPLKDAAAAVDLTATALQNRLYRLRLKARAAQRRRTERGGADD
ncbi:hypothetical protein [Spirillospora sp. CA-294931]|uniref:hypothetical protein n=1 Tax=Spirillospora sp. CA-294931 TaxID=3240042 RepID=UPI003D903055